MHKPPRPGAIIRDEVLAPLNLSIAEAADRLVMSRDALSRVVSGETGISAELALRLEQAGVSTARAWLSMHANYDLWCAMQQEQPPVRALEDGLSKQRPNSARIANITPDNLHGEIDFGPEVGREVWEG
ncbi:MAG: HigA family addiction module antitoxin [Acidihalobacter sp.]|jgi:antitoxin HigA-1|uniref:HigA family addiction module antitoxin n=1 Tax=Acidihalobacter sp. TaxID=1872108 RepID=UPI00307DCC63